MFSNDSPCICGKRNCEHQRFIMSNKIKYMRFPLSPLNTPSPKLKTREHFYLDAVANFASDSSATVLRCSIFLRFWAAALVKDAQS